MADRDRYLTDPEFVEIPVARADLEGPRRGSSRA